MPQPMGKCDVCGKEMQARGVAGHKRFVHKDASAKPAPAPPKEKPAPPTASQSPPPAADEPPKSQDPPKESSSEHWWFRKVGHR